MSEHTHIANMFSAEEEECLDLGQMKAYQEGTLVGEEKHYAERHMLNCELCALAYEGVADLPAETVEAGAEAISGAAWNRVAQQQKKRRRGAIFWMSSAASIALLIVTGYFFMRGPSDGEMESIFNKYRNETEIAAADDRAPKPPSAALEETASLDGGGYMDDFKMNAPAEQQQEVVDKKGQEPPADNWAMTGEIEKVTENAPAPEMELEDAEIEEISMDMPMADAEFKTTTGAVTSGSDFGAELPAKAPPSNADFYKELSKNQVAAAEKQRNEPMGGAYADSTVARPSPKSIQDNRFAGGDDAFAEAEPTMNNEATFDDRLLGAIAMEEESDEEAFDMDEITYEDDDMDGGEVLDQVTVAGKTETRIQAKDLMATNDGPRRKAKSVAAKADKGKSKKARDGNVWGRNKSAASPSVADAKPSSSYDRGMEAYGNKDYKQAATDLRAAAQATPGNLNAHLFAADAFLHIDQPTAAIFHLDRILAQPGNSLYEQAKWFKALAYVKLTERSKAQSLLKEIVEGNGKYKKSAENLLKDLK